MIKYMEREGELEIQIDGKLYWKGEAKLEHEYLCIKPNEEIKLLYSNIVPYTIKHYIPVECCLTDDGYFSIIENDYTQKYSRDDDLVYTYITYYYVPSYGE